MIDPFKGDHHVLMLKKKSRFERKLTFLNSLFHTRSDLLFLFNNLNIFLMNSNSFMRV